MTAESALKIADCLESTADSYRKPTDNPNCPTGENRPNPNIESYMAYATAIRESVVKSLESCDSIVRVTTKGKTA